MTVTSDEVSGNPDAAVEDAMLAFLACIREALPDVCSVGFSIGDSYVPFQPDEDEECEAYEEFCSQAWVRVMQITPKPGGNEGWGGECDLVLNIDLEVGVLRCFEIEKEGEAPTASQSLVAYFQALSDMSAIHRAASACEVWDTFTTGTWDPSGPMGGQYGGTWSFTVEMPGHCLTDESA